MFTIVIVSAFVVFYYWFIFRINFYPSFVRLNLWAEDENIDTVGYLWFIKNGTLIWFLFVFTGWMVKEIFEISDGWYVSYFVITTICLAVILTIGGKQFAYPKPEDVPIGSQTTNTRKNPFLSGILAAIILVGTLLFTYLGYMESAATCDSKKFEIHGLWGTAVPISEICRVDTISLNDLVPVTLRVNGISLMFIKRGTFKMKDFGTVQLNLNYRSNPVIKIVDNAKRFYFVNRKDPKETRRLFFNIQRYLTR